MSDSASLGHAISRDASITIDDFSNPSVNVNCIKIRDDDAWTSRADFGWSNIALTNGVFSGNRLRGQIYGPNHEEVGGVLARTGIDGTFGARRQ